MALSGVSSSQTIRMGGCTFCCCFRTEIQSHWRNESSMSVVVKHGRGRYLGWKTDAAEKQHLIRNSVLDVNEHAKRACFWSQSSLFACFFKDHAASIPEILIYSNKFL